MFRERIKSATRTIFKLGLWLAAITGAVLVLPRAVAHFRYQSNVFWEAQAPAAPVAIVFGAGLQRNGDPTVILRDRVATAVELYRAGKVSTLLLSGDNSSEYYNEPQAMYDYALGLGMPNSALVRDYAGRRTYDTCRRARDIFGVTQALLVTQHYHLDRALLTCDMLGLQVQGVAADRNRYSTRAFTFWWLREFPATSQAVWDLFVSPPQDVILGEPEPIGAN